MWMSRKTKIWIINCCLLFVSWLDFPDPRDVYDMVTGGVKNPQYLFAGSEHELCRRIRMIKDAEGKTKDIFIENYSVHSAHIYYTHEQLRIFISLCHKYEVLGWKMKD